MSNESRNFEAIKDYLDRNSLSYKRRTSRNPGVIVNLPMGEESLLDQAQLRITCYGNAVCFNAMSPVTSGHESMFRVLNEQNRAKRIGMYFFDQLDNELDYVLFMQAEEAWPGDEAMDYMIARCTEGVSQIAGLIMGDMMQHILESDD